ncbi:MAG TPA: hypothetical protein PLF81_03495 [Candidatus Anammoximicrobium sp.]|nr:hypothetical protein [Candidatus Anammoximicrobium sp.]
MAANDEWVFALLMGIGRMLPMFLVWIVGLVFALARWQRAPGVSALVVVAIVVAGLTSVATQVVYTVLPRYWDSMQFAKVAGVIGIASTFMHACAWGCTLAAAFIGRGSPSDQVNFGGMPKGPAARPL